jgi:MFS family permease
MASSVVFAYLNDISKSDRRVVLAAGVAFWSLATALAGLAQNLPQLVFFRSLVGVGEAAYGTIAQPFISDFFPPHERNIAFGFFYLAVPIGTIWPIATSATRRRFCKTGPSFFFDPGGALGFGIGAVIGASYGWRLAFVVCGLPGLVASFWCLRLNDPSRGVNDPLHAEATSPTSATSAVSLSTPPPSPSSARLAVTTPPTSTSALAVRIFLLTVLRSLAHDTATIFQNQHFTWAVLGLAANNFALGG